MYRQVTRQTYNHLKRHHKKALWWSCTRQKTSITTTLYNATPYPPNASSHKEITLAIAYHLAKDMAPINTMQHEGFRKMINTLDKWYSIPSRNLFTNVALCDILKKKNSAGNSQSRIAGNQLFFCYIWFMVQSDHGAVFDPGGSFYSTWFYHQKQVLTDSFFSLKTVQVRP